MRSIHLRDDRRGNLAVWLLLLAAGCVSMLAVALLPTIDSDDALYAVTAREMLATGDWLNLRPEARLLPRPPLTLWLIAVSMRVGGETAMALRFWHALLSVTLVLAIYRLARIDGTREEALLAALLYSTMMQAFYHSLIPQQDVPLTLFLTLGFTEYLAYRRGRASGAALAGIWTALAVLSKGIIAGAVFGLVVAADALIAWRRGQLGHWRWGQVAGGAGVFLAVAAPWFVAGVIKRGPPFVNAFFLKGDVGIGRFLNPRFGFRHAYWKALLSYVPLLAAGVLPWTGWLPGTVQQAWRAIRSGRMVLQLCAVWAGLYFLGISLSPSDKEIRYLLPCFPPLAILAARFLSRALDNRRSVTWAGLISLAVGIAGLLAAWLVRGSFTATKDILIYRVLLPGSVMFFLALAASGVVALRGYGRQAVAVAAAGALMAYGLLAWAVRSQWEWMYPWRTVAAAVRQQYRPGDRLVLSGDIMGETSFVFYYLCPPLDPSLVNTTSFDEAAFLRHWQTDGGAFGLMAPETYARLRDRFRHEMLLTMPTGWVLVIKPRAP